MFKLCFFLGNDEKRKAMMSLLMFGGLYSTLFILGLVAAKLIAFKGLLVGKIALVLAAINGLTKLFNRNRYQPSPYAYSRIDNSDNIETRFAEQLILNSIANDHKHYDES